MTMSTANAPLRGFRQLVGTGGVVVPAIAGLVYLFLLAPSVIIIPLSFSGSTEYIFPPKTLSLDLYYQYMFTSNWVEVTLRSLKVALIVTALSMLLGVPGAYALARAQFPGKGALATLLLSPILVPIIVIALGLYLYLSTLRVTGTLFAVVLAHTVYVVPFVIVTMSAGIKQLDENLEKVATIMGANRVRVLIQVVLPQLVPSLVSAALFSFLMSFDEVVLSWFVTGASTMTLPVKMYSSIQWESSPVLAAVSTILTVLSIGVCLIAARITRGRLASPQRT